MEIKHLTNLVEAYKSSSKINNKGVSEDDIIELEKNLNMKLPLTYKEFLFIAGHQDNILDDWNRGFDNLDFYQDEVKESMLRVNLQLKPFFAFATYGDENALFFFLDEGDNPPVYGYTEEKLYEDENGNELFYKKVRNSFSDEIDLKIKNALK